MNLLDAYNLMLTSVQQEALNDTESQDYEVAQLSNVLNQAKKEILTQITSDFNSHVQTLTKNADNVIIIPDGVIKVNFPPSLRNRVVERQRGEPLWDRLNNEAYTTDITCLLINDVEFDLIPEIFAQWIAWRAAELFSFKLNGASADISYIRGELIKARQIALNSEFRTIDGLAEFGMITSGYNTNSYNVRY